GADPLLSPWRIAPASDRALRDRLDECRAEGIKVALCLMPEHSECRRWYSPQTHAVVRGYLAELTRQYGVPALDLRDWAPDEHFADFCHMAPWGAEPFSERFGRDVLRPLLRNEPLDRNVLLQAP